MDRLRVVYDTVVILQAVLNPDGPAARAIGLMDQGTVTAYISNRLRSEYEDTLTDKPLRAMFPRLTDRRAWEMLDRLDASAIRIPNPPRRVAYLRDPNDEPVLNLAIHVEAQFILTRDKDLLNLADDNTLRRHFPFLRILDPVAFLQQARLT